MPRGWWPTVESARVVIEGEDVWPAASPQSNGVFTPLDVDRYQSLAIVVGYGPTPLGGEPALGVDDSIMRRAVNGITWAERPRVPRWSGVNKAKLEDRSYNGAWVVAVAHSCSRSDPSIRTRSSCMAQK